MKKTLLLVLAFGAAALVSASAADVKENWDKHCAKCHGQDGKGDTKMGKKLEIKDLTDAKVQAEFTDERSPLELQIDRLLRVMVAGSCTNRAPSRLAVSD